MGGEKQQKFGVFFFQMKRLAGGDRPAFLNRTPKLVLCDAARQGEAEPPQLLPGNDRLRKRIDHCGNRM